MELHVCAHIFPEDGMIIESKGKGVRGDSLDLTNPTDELGLVPRPIRSRCRRIALADVWCGEGARTK